MEILLFIVVIWILSSLFGKKQRKQRERRPAFKKLYELDQKQLIAEFEKKMVKGMFRENREVFVTAFVNETHVLRVTATIGSKNKCGNSDNINSWGETAERLGAIAIRQYHNHPDVLGRSFPSSTDRKSHRELKPFVEQWDVNFRSLLVYRGMFGIPVIKEYK